MRMRQDSRRGVMGTIASFAALTGASAAFGGHAKPCWAASASKARWAPFLADPDAVMVTGALVGERIRVLIDTGSAATLVDRALANRLGLTTAGSLRVRGDIGSVALSAGDHLSLDISGVKLATSRYLVADFAPIFGADAPGLILGLDALRNVILDIDFPGRRLIFRPREGFQADKSAQRLDLTRSARGQLAVPVVIEGHDPVAAAIDLGSSNPLTLAPSLADALALLRGRRISSAATGGVDGVSISRTISVTSLQVAGATLRDVPCEVLAKTEPTLFPAKLGLPVLERYRLALDVMGGVLWLGPAPRLLALPFKRDLSGLGLAVEPDRLRVVHVARGGPADLAGWHEGESVLAVNGAPIGPDYVTVGLAGWRYGPVGTKAVLTLSDGTVRTLVLQRYY